MANPYWVRGIEEENRRLKSDLDYQRREVEDWQRRYNQLQDETRREAEERRQDYRERADERRRAIAASSWENALVHQLGLVQRELAEMARFRREWGVEGIEAKPSEAEEDGYFAKWQEELKRALKVWNQVATVWTPILTIYGQVGDLLREMQREQVARILDAEGNGVGASIREYGDDPGPWLDW